MKNRMETVMVCHLHLSEVRVGRTLERIFLCYELYLGIILLAI